MQTPHYLRVACALIAAATLPACSSGSDEPSPRKTDSAEATPNAPPAESPVALAAPSATPDASTPPADAAVDSALPFVSGPIVPPELPEGFA
jgi:hypothetical protein